MEVEFFYDQCMYNILLSLHVSSSHENSLIYAITLRTKAITLSCHITVHAFNSRIVSNRCLELFS